MNTDMETLARAWRNIDEARTKLRREFEAADLDLETKQDQISAVLNTAMAEMGAKKVDTAAGVVERRQQYKVSAADWEAIYRWIPENDGWGLLQKRPSSTFVQTYAEDHDGAVPPGINVFTEFKVGVRKPNGKALPKGE